MHSGAVSSFRFLILSNSVSFRGYGATFKLFVT